MARYGLEIWTTGGELVADISRLATKRKFSVGRNKPEILNFTMDLKTFEDFCTKIGGNPRDILYPYSHDIRVKRDGDYLFGVNVFSMSFKLNPDGQTIIVRADGFLNLFLKRNYSGTITNTDAVDIVHAVITSTQANDRADFGVRRGATQTTTTNRTRTYKNKVIKNLITELTELSTGNFDFVFTHDRQLNTYLTQGVITDLHLFYPSDNLLLLSVDATGQNLYNHIQAFGEAPRTSVRSDSNSQLLYGRHDKLITHNSVKRQATLDEHAAADLENFKDLLTIPVLKVSGANVDLLDLWVGNRIQLSIRGHPYLDDINARQYRVETLAVTLDDNDYETMVVTLDLPDKNRPLPDDLNIAQDVLQTKTDAIDLVVAD